ncbi:MAG: hypothetical protein V4773_30285 [Verrucomicrobiota bacterium]
MSDLRVRADSWGVGQGRAGQGSGSDRGEASKSDLVGGWMLADAFVVELRKSDVFRTRVAACRAEVEAFLKK